MSAANRVNAERPDAALDAIAMSVDHRKNGDRRIPISGVNRDTRQSTSRMHTRPLSDFNPQAVRWFWKHRLAFGKVHVVDGFPSQGKSTFVMDIAARASRGSPMPDGERGPEPIEVLYVSYEDDIADTLLPRLLAAGGDPARVHIVDYVERNGSDNGSPVLPQDLDVLERVFAVNPNIRLVVIDPLMAALGGAVDSYKDQSMRPVLARLARMAAETGACFVLIRHINKRGGPNAITAGGGTIGIIGQARVGLLIDRHPENESASVLAVSKSNIGPKPPSLSFMLETTTLRHDTTGETVETCRLKWSGPVTMSADDLVAARFDGGDQDDDRDAVRWLREALPEGVEHERGAVMAAGRAAGYSERTIKRAGKACGVAIRRQGNGLEHRSYWRIPTQTTRVTRADVA